jgi:hypothetical protein
MEIGKPLRKIVVEPIRDPVPPPARKPKPEPAPSLPERARASSSRF